MGIILPQSKLEDSQLGLGTFESSPGSHLNKYLKSTQLASQTNT